MNAPVMDAGSVMAGTVQAEFDWLSPGVTLNVLLYIRFRRARLSEVLLRLRRSEPGHYH